MVHDNRPHADQHIILNSASVYDGIMCYAYIISDLYRCLPVSAMYGNTILYINIITDADIGYIAPHNCIEPHTAIVAHYYIANDGGIIGQETIAANFGMYAFYGFQKCHDIFLFYYLWFISMDLPSMASLG